MRGCRSRTRRSSRDRADPEALRIEALQADNARLSQDHAQSDEAAKRLEQPLRARAESIATLEKALVDEAGYSRRTCRAAGCQAAWKGRRRTPSSSSVITRSKIIRDSADLNQRLQLESAASADPDFATPQSPSRTFRQSDSLLLDRDEVLGKRC